jgi:hypothetical protein
MTDDPLYKQLLEIKIGQDRILGHHDEFKEALNSITNKFEEVRKSIHEEALARHKGDSDIKDNCKDDVRSIYRNVAVGGLVCISGLVGAILLFLANN